MNTNNEFTFPLVFGFGIAEMFGKSSTDSKTNDEKKD